MKRLIFLIFLLPAILSAQTTISLSDINTIHTAVPFLTIAPDTKGAAMGDVGVATTPDAASMHWNPAKYGLIADDAGVTLHYSPWLRSLVNDMNLLYLSGFKRIDDMQTIGASLRYFNMGSITFRNEVGTELGVGKPNEFAVDVAYSRKFGKKFSAAIALRYIRSDISSGISSGGTKAKAGNSVAADVAVYYLSDFQLADRNAWWSLGLNISNIGAKMSYSNDLQKSFLPANLRLGGSFGLNIDHYNSLSIALDFNKLLVPTPAVYDLTTQEIIAGKNPNVGVAQGLFQSFADAPGGFKEEMREWTFGVGLEYKYRSLFALRTGYFHEHPTKGNRRYVTAGLGFSYKFVGIDFSYLISTQGQQNTLNNTIRLGATFTFGKGKALANTDNF